MVNNVEAIVKTLLLGTIQRQVVGCKGNRYRSFLQKYCTSLIKLYIVEILLSIA